MPQKIEPGTYKHYKGNNYLVLGIAKHSETLADLVVYVALYTNQTSAIWVRPAESFLDKVKVNGKLVDRFTRIV